MSDSNRVSIKYVKEVTPGTTPVDDAGWKSLRYNTQSLAGQPNTAISDEIRSDRHVSDLLLVGQEVGGAINTEFSYGSYDDFLESAMGAAWATNVLKAGVVDDFYSIEVGYEDWTPIQYLQFKGMRIGGFNFNFPYGEKITGGFQLVGFEQLDSTTSLVGAGSTAAVGTTDIMNGSSDVSGIKIDTVAATDIFKSISLNLNNTPRAIEGLGTIGARNQKVGRSLITGSLETYFDDITLYNKLLASTAVELEWTVSDGTSSYAFLLPKIKFTSGAPNAGGVDSDVMMPLDFTALYDTTEATNLKITRTP